MGESFFSSATLPLVEFFTFLPQLFFLFLEFQNAGFFLFPASPYLFLSSVRPSFLQMSRIWTFLPYFSIPTALFLWFKVRGCLNNPFWVFFRSDALCFFSLLENE